VDTTSHPLGGLESESPIISAREVWRNQNLHTTADGNIKWCSHSGKHPAVPQEVKELLLDLDILLLDMYPREIKTYAHTKTCTQMFKCL